MRIRVPRLIRQFVSMYRNSSLAYQRLPSPSCSNSSSDNSQFAATGAGEQQSSRRAEKPRAAAVLRRLVEDLIAAQSKHRAVKQAFGNAEVRVCHEVEARCRQ